MRPKLMILNEGAGEGGVTKMQTQPKKSAAFRECERIKSNGLRCQSPALRGESLCYFHHPEAREVHRMRQVALLLHPNKVAMLNFAERWPKNPSKELRRFLIKGFQLIARIDARSAAEEPSEQGLSKNSLSQQENAKDYRGPSTRAFALAQDDRLLGTKDL